MTSSKVVLLAITLTGGLLARDAVPARAQSQLEQVERLTRLGRAEEARAALLAWWDGDRSEASRRELQRGLWLRARLTVDPIQAEIDFQRLALLYPRGQFTPDAIFRLAQASWAMGDEEATRRYMAALERDYPRSDAYERAVQWLADAGPLPPPGDTPTRAGDGGAGEPSPDAGPGAPTDSTAAAAGRAQPTGDPDPDEPAPDAPSGEASAGGAVMNYYVQLGAFAEEERAFALYEEVSAQAVDVRVVRVVGSQFTHVRVGRFAEREAAVELLEELTAQGINAALVRDDRVEETIRE